jgi:protein SYS1
MISLGVWACRYRELRPISFGMGAKAVKGAEARAREGGQEEIMTTDDQVRGGRGRGRNRDEGPSYEMVAIKEENGDAV